MVSIATTAATSFRDFVTDGVSSSGPYDPAKADLRSIFAQVDNALSTVVQGITIGNAIIYSVLSGLTADLAHPANTIAIVYNDGVSANNGVYIKVGASGSGSWSLTNISLPASALSTLSSALSAETVRAEAAEATLTTNLSSEASRAETAESSLGTSISTETSRAEAAESTLTANLSNEVSRAEVAEGALTTSISTEASVRAAADNAEASTRSSADSVLTTSLAVEVTNRLAADAANEVLIAANTATISVHENRLNAEEMKFRPGESPYEFTTQLVGPPATAPEIPPSWIFQASTGLEVVVPGAAIIATRNVYLLRPSRIYNVEFSVQRRTDTPDPAGDGVYLTIAWYDQVGNQLTGANAITIVDTLTTLSTGSGQIVFATIIAKASGTNINFVAPSAAVYARPFVQTYGTVPTTAVQTLSLTDITNVTLSAPDVTAVSNRVTTLESVNAGTRLTALESEVGTPSSVAFLSHAAAVSGTIPSTVNVISILGYDVPGFGPARYKRTSASPTALTIQNAGGNFDLIEDHLTLPMVGGESDGSADITTALTRTPRSRNVIASYGTYQVGTTVDDPTLTLLVDQGTTFSGSGYMLADVQRHWLLYAGRRSTLADVWSKGRGSGGASGTAIRGACLGDSLTYGLDVTSTGTGSGINGSSATRSPTPYPDAFHQCMSIYFNNGMAIDNLGFPGDTTLNAVSRWASTNWSIYDFVVIMLGTNDKASLSISQFRRYYRFLIERCLLAGCAVVLVMPPKSYDMISSEDIRGYAGAVRQLAREYDLPCVDSDEQLRSMRGKIWTDGLHLTPAAYQELGWHIASLFIAMGQECLRHVGPETALFAYDAVSFQTSSVFAQADANASYGYSIEIQAGAYVLIPVFVEADCEPVITTIYESAASNISYFYGQLVTPTQVYNNNLNGSILLQGSTRLPVLRRGYRVLTFYNGTSVTGYIDKLEFRPIDSDFRSSGGLWQRVEVAPHRPATGITGPEFYSAGKRFPYTRMISGVFTLDPVQAGGMLLINGDDQFAQGPSANSIIIFRASASLVVRQIVAGTGTDTIYTVYNGTSTPVFTSGATFVGRIEAIFSPTALLIYVEGRYVGTITNPAFYGGCPGWYSAAAGTVVQGCSSLMVAAGPDL